MDIAKEIRKGEELDWKKLESHLREAMPDLEGDFTVSQFHGGHANLTYLLNFGGRELVLRRPPFGKIAPGAHSMKREFKVLSRLNEHFPQAPLAFYHTQDPDVIGAEFVVMQRRTGVVIRKHIPECFSAIENIENRLTIALVKTLSDLHNIDVEAADLSHLGRPENFMQRQLAGWTQRWDLSKTEENKDMNELKSLLAESIPAPQKVAIVHNDLKFDNCQFQADNPDQITSVFDWDMTTLGDPLADFGATLSYWPDPILSANKSIPVMLKGDFPEKAFLKEEYQKLTGLNLDNIAWYESFSLFKLTVIAQQLYKRFVDGATADKRMAAFGESAKAMAFLSRKIAERI